MYARTVPALLLLLLALLAGCQPIQPEAAAPAVAATTDDDLATTEFVAIEIPTAGVSLSLPADWHTYFEPRIDRAILLSQPMPHDAQTVAFWPYLATAELPYASVNVTGGPISSAAPDDRLLKLLEIHFASTEASLYSYNTEGKMTFVEGPEMTETGGRPSARGVMEGIDVVSGDPFKLYVWATRNGKRIAYVSVALLDENAPVFLPVVEQIVETVEASEPVAMERPAPVATGEIRPGETVIADFGQTPPDSVLRDYWHFTGEPGKRYLATITPLNSFTDIVADVVDSTGKSLLYYEMDDEYPGMPEQVGLTSASAGDYYVVVRTYFETPGPYKITLEELQ